VIIEFQSILPASFTATFINMWNDQGWNNVDMYVSSDGSSWTLVKEILSELPYSTKEDVPGRTTEIHITLPSEEIQVTIDANAIDGNLYKVTLPIVDYKSLYFEPGNSVGFKSTSTITIPTNSFAWSYWVKFDTGLYNCTNAYLGGPPHLFPYFISETNDEVVIRGYASSSSSVGTNDRTLSKGIWHHICRTYILPDGVAHSSSNVWREAYYINGQIIYNEDVNPTSLRIPSHFDSYPYPPEDNTTLMHTTNTWEFDLYWNYARARTLRPNDNNHENTYVNAQIAHFALWMDTHLTQEAVNELYNAGHGILQPPTKSPEEIQPSVFKYTFEVSAVNPDRLWNGPISHIWANDVGLHENTTFIRIQVDIMPESPHDVNEDITHLTDSSTSTNVVWRDNNQPVGTVLFHLYFTSRVYSFKIRYARPKYANGWKIYENNVEVYKDATHHGNDESPAPYDVIYSLNTFEIYDAYTLYDNATHYYPFGDNGLSDIRGTNNLQFFRVQSNSLVYDTGDATGLTLVSFPLAQPPVTISELLNLDSDVIYTNVLVDEFGNVSNFTFIENYLYIEIPIYPESIRINNITDGYLSTTNHNFPSVEPDKYYNMYANVINTHTNTTLSQLLNSDVIIVTPITITLSNALTFNVQQHNITVSLVSTGQGLKYYFDPSVTSFQRGDIYVFDNTSNSGDHPLNFHNTNNIEPFIYQQDIDGFVTVNNFSDYDVLFAHCTFHANMGSIVNNDTSGISVINSSHPRQYYVTLTVTNFNGGGFSIDTINPPTMTDASYDRFDNDKLYFTFNNATTAVNKNLYVKVIDSSGITEELTKEYIFPSDHIPMFTNKYFTFTSINSYGYSFRLNGVTYDDSSPFPNSTIIVTPPAPFVDGTINASIEFTNAYGFNGVYSLDSQTVTKPTAASQLKLAPYGYSGFTATYYKDGDDGNPVDTRPSVSVYLYYQETTASNPIVSRTNYEGIANITLNNTVNLDVRSPNTIYSFIICKEYDNYGFIDSEVYYSNQLEVSSVVSFILGQSIKDLNNRTYSGSSQTLTWRNVTINDTGTANTNFQNQEGYKINTRDDKKYFEVNRVNTNGHRFGEFDIGPSSFTIAFVISTKDLDSTWHLTAGLDNTTHFNIHFGKIDTHNWNNFTIFPPNGGSRGDLSHYFNAKYCFLMYTFNHAQNNGECIRSLFNDVGNYGTSQDVYDNVYSLTGRDTFNSGNTSSRSFTLASSWRNRQSIKIFDMIILPEVSITTDFVSNVATDPNFGMILDYVSRHFGFTTGTA
jgi:hypothetical protein